MGVGLTIAVEVDSVAAQRDRERELIAIGRQFRTAIGRYYETQLAGGRREYPASLDDLLRDNRTPGMRRYLRKVFVDPMTAKAEWGFIRANGRIVGVHSLSTQVPIKQEGFEPEDMALRGKKQINEWLFTYPADVIVQSDGKVILPTMPASPNSLPGGSNPIPAVQGIQTTQGAPAALITTDSMTSVGKP